MNDLVEASRPQISQPAGQPAPQQCAAPAAAAKPALATAAGIKWACFGCTRQAAAARLGQHQRLDPKEAERRQLISTVPHAFGNSPARSCASAGSGCNCCGTAAALGITATATLAANAATASVTLSGDWPPEQPKQVAWLAAAWSTAENRRGVALLLLTHAALAAMPTHASFGMLPTGSSGWRLAAVAGMLPDPDLCWSSVAAVPPFHTTMDLHISHSSGP